MFVSSHAMTGLNLLPIAQHCRKHVCWVIVIWQTENVITLYHCWYLFWDLSLNWGQIGCYRCMGHLQEISAGRNRVSTTEVSESLPGYKWREVPPYPCRIKNSGSRNRVTSPHGWCGSLAVSVRWLPQFGWRTNKAGECLMLQWIKYFLSYVDCDDYPYISCYVTELVSVCVCCYVIELVSVCVCF